MAEKSGFFNARKIAGEYDRKYNANDYADNLAVVVGNGVLRSANDDLKVTANGMILTVGVGRAWIEGHYYLNDSPLSLAAVTAPSGGSRWDRVMLRLDKSIAQRRIYVVYVAGTAGNDPVKPAPTREGDVYDLVLADIYVTANAQSVSVTDTRGDTSVCGWTYSVVGDNAFFTTLDNSFNEWFAGVRDTLSSVTLFKQYKWRTVLTEETNTIQFNIPQFDEDTCFIDVYVNGLLDTEGVEYTRSGNILTGLGLPLTAGSEVEVNCYKSIDGTGIMTVADEITALQNAVDTLDGVSKYTYKCTGLNDNVSLSQIAQAFYTGSYVQADVSAAAGAFLSALGGNTYLAALPVNAQITIDVAGKMGATSPVSGSGTVTSRYKWFDFGTTSGEKRLIFDFGKCELVKITCSTGTDNIIFYGSEINLKNATVDVTSGGSGCNVAMLVGNYAGAPIACENCRLKIVTSGTAVIANYGYFADCSLHVKSTADNSYCVDQKGGANSRLIGGIYYAYTADSSKISSVFNVEATEGDTAKIMAYNISCPNVAQTGYYQRYLCRSNAGMTYINGVISALTSTGTASKRTINGQI